MPTVDPHQKSTILHFGFAAVIILMILVTAVGVERMIDNNRRLGKIVTQRNAKTDMIQTMYTAARERSITLLRMVNLEDPFEREEQFEHFNELGTRFAVARIALSRKEFDEQEQALFVKQGELIRETVPSQMEVIDLLVSDDIEAAVSKLLNEAIPKQDKVLAHLQTMLDYQQESARQSFNEATTVVRRTTVFMVALSLVAILISASIAFAVIRKSRRDELALRDARDRLELRVKERTRELSEAYEELKLHERKIAGKNRTLESLSTKLSKYLSPQVYASIFSGKQEVRLASKRKKLTIFFSDIEGFTETTDRMESEDLTQIINQYLTEMSRVALEHGATIDKYIGDAIMVFFGDPETRGVEEDARSCVMMALAMQRRLEELADIWRASGFDTPLTSRIGIHTGYCTVGNFGSEDRMDYTIIGGAVNLASRLEQEAPAGGILISYDTYAHVKDDVLCEPAGELKLRGIAYPVAAFRVLGAEVDRPRASSKLHADLPNLKFRADPGSMDDEQRGQAIRTLEEALEVLRSRRL